MSSMFLSLAVALLGSPALAQSAECDQIGPTELLPADHACCDEPLWATLQYGDASDDGVIDISDVYQVGVALSYGVTDPWQIFVEAWLDHGVNSVLSDVNGDGLLTDDDFDHLVGYLFLGTHSEPEEFCVAPVESHIW